MFNVARKFKQALFFLLFLQLWIWTIMSLAGCGGSENIPPDSILTSGEVTLTWEEVTGAATYNVYFSKSPSVTVFNSYRISDATSPITITDMEFDTTYYFIITLEDDSGQIRKSKEMSYTVVNTEGSIQFGKILSHSEPNAAVSDSKPTAKASTSKTHDVTLGWKDVPNATSYNIYWSDKPGVTKKNGIKISNVKNPHKITGLIKGEKYYFVVTAVNASAESKESEEISFIVEQ
ncbi:MAG: fibronectin type III domain-containing protein [Proteobacteria bacterium]|nr:fibronectin type III domain-containing protein [Pseudomonadota bacterium]